MILHRSLCRAAKSAVIGFALANFTVAPVTAQEPAVGPPVETPQAPVLPETDVVAEPDEAAPQQAEPNFNNFPSDDGLPSILEGTIFSSPVATGYGASSSTTGMGFNSPDIDIPATINVVTEPLRRDQQALRMDDILRDIGAANKASDQLRPDAFFLRGFEVQSRDFRKNGFLDPTYTPRDFANVDRVEVIKGPASFLYGAQNPSGTVNFITKMPTATPINDGYFTFGSFGLTRYTVDSAGAVDQDQRLLYRFNGAFEDRDDSFRDFGYQQRTFLAPSLSYIVDDNTIINWQGEYLRDHRQFDTGVAAIGGNVRALPIERFLGEPAHDFQQFEDFRSTVSLTHVFANDWTLYLGGYDLAYRAPSAGTIPTADFPLPPLGPTIIRRTRQEVPDFDEQYHSFIANVAGDAQGRFFNHRMLLGTEQGWFISDRFRSLSSTTFVDPLPIDAVNPVYTNPTPFVFPASVFDSSFRQNRHGFYAQDLVDVTEQWKLVTGIRYDHVDQTYFRTITPVLPPTHTEDSFDRWSPRVGVTFQPGDIALSYYGMYSKSFVPSGGSVVGVATLQPEIGDIWEGGVKAAVFENWNITAGGFFIEKQNVAFSDFNGAFFQTFQVAEQRSQGFEFNAVGELTERMSMIANYAYTDALIHDPTNPTRDNKRVRNVPFNTANVWSRYNFMDRMNRRRAEIFGAALGLVYVGERSANLSDTVQLPDYARWDAGLFYTLGQFDALVYFENIFDRQYYTGSVNELQIYPGAPVNLRAQVGMRF